MIIKRIKGLVRLLRTIEKQNAELLWAKTWDDTKNGIPWMDNLTSISPGRWAVGYNFIYVLTRILEEKQPGRILDIGLGISSTIISCYASYLNDKAMEHIIVEQDKNWVNFYLKKHKLSPSSQILIMDLVEKPFFDGGVGTYHSYDKFAERIKGKQFSLISIDGPWGSERHSRRDIVDFLPDLLEKDWVIIMDDTERPGERETIAEIESVLN